MKKIFLTLLMLISTTAFSADKPFAVYDFPIIRVIDGDTVVFEAKFLPAPLKPELRVRIYGVDTPEKGSTAKCSQEVEMGKAASEFTRQQIRNAQTRQVVIMSWDKYGGRVLGDLLLNGKSLRQTLIEQGYAREYYGGFKSSWCK